MKHEADQPDDTAPEILRESAEERAPLVFEYPSYMDAETAAWVLDNQRKRGLISEEACRRADRYGVLYVLKESKRKRRCWRRLRRPAGRFQPRCAACGRRPP